MTSRWTSGNQVVLLENGEEFYPRVFERIAGARDEVLLETFILFDDKVGRELHDALLAAAKRGAKVTVTVDGYGSFGLTTEFIRPLLEAGVVFQVFDPQPRLLGMRANIFRRLHRKIVVVDGAVAFIGGINFSHDHLSEFGEKAKQDYAVEVRGPVVADIVAFSRRLRAPEVRHWWHRAAASPPPDTKSYGHAEVLFVTRDNERHRTDIEREYVKAMRSARREIFIANAYFLPGYRFLRELRHAAGRGVEVHLILQGEPDMPWVQKAVRMLYHELVHAGINIYEYAKRPLHGKVAVIDGEWSTVGSSNLDPLSLSLNLEANLVIRDSHFAADLRHRLLRLRREHCYRVDAAAVSQHNLAKQLLNFLIFHFLRHFPSWTGWLPAHSPRLRVPLTECMRAGCTEKEQPSRRTA